MVLCHAAAETELLDGEEEEEEEQVMLEGGLQGVQAAGYHNGERRRLQQCKPVGDTTQYHGSGVIPAGMKAAHAFRCGITHQCIPA